MNPNWTLLLVAALALTGCSSEPAGPDLHVSQTIDRDTSELVRVNLDLSGGTIKVAGGTDKLAAATFNYGANASKPEVEYSTSASDGNLIIKQSGSSSTLAHTSKDWDLRLNQNVPMEIEVHIGSGEARLKLGVLTLRSVNVEIRRGRTRSGHRGSPKASYQVRVRGGAGNATIHLPSSVGVEAEATGAIGDIDAGEYLQRRAPVISTTPSENQM